MTEENKEFVEESDVSGQQEGEQPQEQSLEEAEAVAEEALQEDTADQSEVSEDVQIQDGDSSENEEEAQADESAEGEQPELSEEDAQDAELPTEEEIAADLKEDTPQEEEKPWEHGLDREFGEDDYPRPEIQSVIESILFASDEPVSAAKLMSIAEISSTKQVKEAVDNLNERYREMNSAFKIEQIAGGYQMMTHRVYNHWLLKLIRVRTESKLTQAALETLAIVAYKQPIIRADVEAIRGVSSGEMIRGLMQKGLVKIAGRAEVIGRPMLYGTTKKFLEVFGLNTLKDLPKVEELKKPK